MVRNGGKSPVVRAWAQPHSKSKTLMWVALSTAREQRGVGSLQPCRSHTPNSAHPNRSPASSSAKSGSSPHFLFPAPTMPESYLAPFFPLKSYQQVLSLLLITALGVTFHSSDSYLTPSELTRVFEVSPSVSPWPVHHSPNTILKSPSDGDVLLTEILEWIPPSSSSIRPLRSSKRHFKLLTLLRFSGWYSSMSIGPKRP